MADPIKIDNSDTNPLYVENAVDMAFWEVWQDDANKVIHYRRIASPRDITSLFHAVAYLDGNILENACLASEQANDGQVTRSKLPGDWALAQHNAIDINTFKHTFDYTVKYI